ANPNIPKEAQPQKTALVWTGRKRPKLNQLAESNSGATNLIPMYSPTVVPNNNQKVADIKYQTTSLLNSGLTLGRGTARFLGDTTGEPGEPKTFKIPRSSFGAAAPESSSCLKV